MKNENKKLKIATLASGAVMLTAFGTVHANAASLLDFENLGTGSQLRSNLLTADALNAFTANTDIEFECGEGKCGEGKCGDHGDKKDKKKDGGKKAEAKPAGAKAAEAQPAKGSKPAGSMEAAPAATDKPAKPASEGVKSDGPKK